MEQKTFTRTVTKVTHTTYTKKPGGWQLPCGCTGPAMWSCEDLGQAWCDACGRGWWFMGRTSATHCVMLDGRPQGDPIIVEGYVPIDLEEQLTHSQSVLTLV